MGVRRRFAGMSLGLVAIIASSRGLADDAAPPDLSRVSSSFELTHVGPILRLVAKQCGKGFTRADARSVAVAIEAIPAETPRAWAYRCEHGRDSSVLQVRARLDDLGTLDLDLFASAPLAARLRAAVDGYLDSHGL